MLTGTAGQCSGKEVNDQQASSLWSDILDLVNCESTASNGRGRQDGGTEERKRGGVERFHGAEASGMGANRKQMPE